MQDPDTVEARDAAGLREVTLGHLLVEAAIQCPEADAVIGDFGSVSYSDLLIQAQNIAVVLKRHGAGPGKTVGVAIEPSPMMIASIAGTILTGAAYACLKRGLHGRAAMKALGISLILCDGATPAGDTDARVTWKEFASVLDVSRIEQETMPLSGDTRMGQFSTTTTAAVVLNESAESEPHMVYASHGTIANLSVAAELPTQQMRFGAGDIFALHGAEQNRSGLFEIWSSLLHGASLAIEPNPALETREFANWVRRAGVSVLCLPVKRVHEFMDPDVELFANLRHLVIESDGKHGAISPQRVEQLLRLNPRLHIVHVFSTAGIAGYATAFHVPARYSAQSDLPIGLPLPGLQAHVLDGMAQPVRKGEIGELAFSGAEVCDANLCRTGERARLRADGLLELHGHTEAQKIMPAKALPVPAIQSEVHPAIEESIDFGAGKPTSEPTGAEMSAEMMPPMRIAKFAEPNGALSARDESRPLQPRQQSGVHSLSVEGYQQKTLDHLRALWLRLLRRNAIGWEDDFYEAGGTQVHLIRMHAELNRRYPGAITMSQLSVLTSIRKIYEHLMRHAAHGGAQDMVQRGA